MCSIKLYVCLLHITLDSCLLDALSVANDVTAGIVPINSIDASSSSSGSNSQGLQVLWASRSSSDIFGRRNDAPVELLQSFVREVSSGTSYFNIIVKVSPRMSVEILPSWDLNACCEGFGFRVSEEILSGRETGVHAWIEGGLLDQRALPVHPTEGLNLIQPGSLNHLHLDVCVI